MNTRNSALTVIAILTIVAGASSLVFAYPVFIYSSQFGDMPIPAPDDPEREYGKGRMADAIIEIPDHFTIYDLDIGIDLTHESLYDLQILLKSPAGTKVYLNLAGNSVFIRRGEDGRLEPIGGATKMLFDDEANISIEEATEPFFGPYRPVGPKRLSMFDGQDAYGTWRLQIHDIHYAHTGKLENFELMITVPEPTTAILLALGTGLMSLFGGNCKNIRSSTYSYFAFRFSEKSIQNPPL